MDLRLVDEMRVFHMIEIDGERFEAGVVEEVLEGLEDTQSFSRIVINDNRLERLLERLGACVRSVRGSVYRGPNYETVRAQIMAVIDPQQEAV